ncbi:S8 family serine peptidase [Streptomyces sp. L7]
MFGGAMNGAAPGVKIVSERACVFGPGCTNVAMTEGMIDLVVNRGVDLVNMSIGGLPALNDGNNALAELYTRLIGTYGVQLVISAGNSGPGVNTIGDPGLADKVISVGAGVSRQTWAANYGAGVKRDVPACSPSPPAAPARTAASRRPSWRPAAAVSTIQAWMPGSSLDEGGLASCRPATPCYSGTSMASPQASGAGALLLSAAEQQGIALTRQGLCTALTSTARPVKGLQAYEQGAGLIDIVGAWTDIQEGAAAHDYTVKAPVDTVLAQALKTLGLGTGVYDREGGLKAGQKRTYDASITRTTGPAGSAPARPATRRTTKAGTFGIPEHGGPSVEHAGDRQGSKRPRSARVSRARSFEADDPATEGVDKQILVTAVVSDSAGYTFSASGSVQRGRSRSYFVTVPEGAKSLGITLSGLPEGSVTGLLALSPYGIPVDPVDPVDPDVNGPGHTRPGSRTRCPASGRSGSSRGRRRCPT